MSTMVPVPAGTFVIGYEWLRRSYRRHREGDMAHPQYDSLSQGSLGVC